MFGRDTHTPKHKKPFEPRPLKTASIEQVLNPTDIPELGTQEPYDESYFWWINPENTVILEDIATLYRYQYGENFTSHTPLEKENSIWYTQYPVTEGNSGQNFEIPEVWGGNKRQVSIDKVTRMSSDPKAPEVMECQGGEGDEGNEKGDELALALAPCMETMVTDLARTYSADGTPRSPVGLDFLAK